MPDTPKPPPGKVTVRLNKPWRDFTAEERKAFLDAVTGRVFPGHPGSTPPPAPSSSGR